MPRINLTITNAWRHGTDARIHFTVERHDSEKTRHLYVDPGKGLYAHLDAALEAKGYRYPKSAEEQQEAEEVAADPA